MACLTASELTALEPGQPIPERHFAHLASCAACRKAVDAALRETEVEGEVDGPFDVSLDAVPLEEPARYRRATADGKPVLLGAGGYARVELARDEVIGRDVALKSLRSSQLASPRRAVTERRLLQEARVVGQLEHPAIVPLYDLARTDAGELFYVMRRIRGRTLAAAITAAPDLDARLRLLPHVLAACHAVAFAHSRGVLHRDLKPHNVMIDRFGETLVIDWGLASTRADDDLPGDVETSGAIRLVTGDETLSDGRGRLGTPAYMSPEQLTGLRALVDARSDVFGLGGILYEVLTGKAPREEGPLEVAPRKVREVEPAIPPDLAALCDKALEPSRSARYQAAEELARDLDAWLHGQRVTAHAYRPMELVRRFVQQHRLTVLVASVAVVLLAAVAITGALRVRDERNHARSFALLLSDEVLRRLPFEPRDAFRSSIAQRVGAWLADSSDASDPGRAADAWARLALEHNLLSRHADAVSAAARCLALVPEVVDEHGEATALTCRVIELDELVAPEEVRHQRYLALWEGRRTRQPQDPQLLTAQLGLLLSLSNVAGNLAREAEAARWSAESLALAQHLAERAPEDAEAWALLSHAQYVRSFDELNAGAGADAVAWARASVEAAQRAHTLEHSSRSLLRVADMASNAHLVHTVYPALVPGAERDATVREAQRAFEAVFALDESDPLVRRRYADLLVALGEPARAWELVKRVPIENFFEQRAQLYLALLVGEGEVVVRELAREPAETRSFDHPVLLALAHAVAGRFADAATHARAATRFEYASFWPGDPMASWGAGLGGRGGPAVARLTAELTAAQKANDGARAKAALEAFAVAVEAL